MRRTSSRRWDDLPHYVYRIYDDRGNLIYVGCTLNIATRLQAHRRDAEWWHHAATVGLVSYATRRLARGVEGRAIRDELPLFNRQYQPEAVARAVGVEPDPIEDLGRSPVSLWESP